MKPKFAIGVTINGNEVRAAFLSLVRGKARIKALESTTLAEPLEAAKEEASKESVDSLNSLESAFDINEPQLDEEESYSDTHSTEQTSENQNVSLIYGLLDRFENIKANIAINSPVLTVKYDYTDKSVLQKEKNLKKRLKARIDIWGSDSEDARRTKYVNIADDKVLQVDYEYHPPIIDLVEEVNQFRAGNLNLVLMDTNELALVDLVREIYKFKADEITAIVYIEQDFSRVIFLKGREIYHITPIIHKGSMSKDVLEVIYSRIIFAQDQHFIPELNKILVAGHSSRLKAKYYFRQKFPYAITGYLNSKKIESDLRFKDRGMLFSRYAVPIALAWKALQKNVYSSKQFNLLPEYIMERQTLPKLTVYGYVLLLLLTFTAFAFTWIVVQQNLKIQQVTRRIESIKTQLASNQTLTDQVLSYDGEISDLENRIALIDSLSKGYNETAEFLKLFNKTLQQVGDIWITELTKGGKIVQITGMATRRARIPQLADALGGANLKRVSRMSFQGAKVFSFQIDLSTDKLDLDTTLHTFEGLKIADGKAGGKAKANGSQGRVAPKTDGKAESGIHILSGSKR